MENIGTGIVARPIDGPRGRSVPAKRGTIRAKRSESGVRLGPGRGCQFRGEEVAMQDCPRLIVLNLLLSIAAITAAAGCTGTAAAEPAMSDEEIERFLLKGKVVESKEVGTGITKPWKVTLELEGKTMRALFKDIDVYKPGMTKFPDGKSEMNFSDKYVYERAAYLMDRRLGMKMVPVAVNRQWSGKSGAMVQWVEDAIAENDRIAEGLEPDDPVVMDHQKAIMKLFDALIYNVDRNQTNMLYTRPDWKLHLIDHSRSFRRSKKLPEIFMAKPVSLPRSMLEELQSLDDKELKALLKNLVTGPQIKTMLQRRDLILQKVADDRESYGDNLVFQD
jgi:hypothetical protein